MQSLLIRRSAIAALTLALLTTALAASVPVKLDIGKGTVTTNAAMARDKVDHDPAEDIFDDGD